MVVITTCISLPGYTALRYWSQAGVLTDHGFGHERIIKGAGSHAPNQLMVKSSSREAHSVHTAVLFPWYKAASVPRSLVYQENRQVRARKSTTVTDALMLARFLRSVFTNKVWPKNCTLVNETRCSPSFSNMGWRVIPNWVISVPHSVIQATQEDDNK